MEDINDPAHPQCALQPAPEVAELYAMNRAEYLEGLEHFEQHEYQLALSKTIHVFSALHGTLLAGGARGMPSTINSSAESEDQACLNLLMHALTIACHSKLHLGQPNICTALCMFLMEKASEVPWQARLFERLQHIWSLAEEEQVC